MSKIVSIDDLRVGDFVTRLSDDGEDVYVARVTKVCKLRTLVTWLKGKTACVHTVMFPYDGQNDDDLEKSTHACTWTRNFIPFTMYASTWPEVLAWIRDAYATTEICDRIPYAWYESEAKLIRGAMKQKVDLSRLAPFDDNITEEARQIPKSDKQHSWLWDTLRNIKVWDSVLSPTTKGGISG